MPKSTNGVYQDHSVSPQDCGVGRGAAYPVNGSVGMGGNQYAKHDKSGGPPSSYGKGGGGSHGKSSSSHDQMGNRTYK